MSTSTARTGFGLTRRLVLTGLASGTLASVAPGQHANAAVVNGVLVGKDGWLFLAWDSPERADLARVRQVAQLANAAVAILKRANIETAIVLNPAKTRVYRDALPDGVHYLPDAERRYAVALEELRRPGTLVPDLDMLFASVRKARPSEELFFKANTHWTALGAETAAVEVATEIKQRFRLPPSSRPGTQLGPYVKRLLERKDLADMLPPAERSKYPLEEYFVHQVLNTQGQAALLDDDSDDTAVVGNSYMHPLWNFVPMLSNQLNRPVWLAWKVHLVGPYRTLIDYVGSEPFRRQRPKLVVWNLHELDMECAPNVGAVWGQNAMPPQAFLSNLSRAIGV
jgi:alginate O-acetyltransferase complex protein AlgJ